MNARILRRALPWLIVVAWSNTSAQQICSTPVGTCGLMGNLQPGTSCYCFYPNGAVQGVVAQTGQRYVPNATPAPAPFCCTPAGRFGPFAPRQPGSYCYVQFPNGGVANGQACY
jgi:hypothetical protein